MSQQAGIVKGDALQRLGSLGFIIGAVLLIVFNALFPRAADPSSMQDMVTTLGSKEGLVVLCSFFKAVGLWGIMIGFAGVYRSITASGAAWARLGFYGIIVGTTLGTINFGLLMASANTGAEWLAAAAADKAAAYSTAAAVHTVNMTALTMWILVAWLAFVFLGIGMARSAVYPKWQGWALLILGILTVAIVGIPVFFAGFTATTETLFMILAALSTILALIVGIWVARKAW